MSGVAAGTLREAAALMRQRHAAIGGSGSRWKVAECEGHNRDSRRTLGQYSLVHDDVSEVAIVRGFSNEREVVSDFIASWHPAVALAVADLLENEANALDGGHMPENAARTSLLTTVARAYLGEDA